MASEEVWRKGAVLGIEEVIEEDLGVAGIVTALVEACKTGLVGGILLRMRLAELEDGLSSQG